MTENKRFELAYEKGNWWAIRDGELTLWKEEVVSKLNEQEERIKELEKEKQDLKDKAEILVDYYSRRYVNAISNNGKHSKQFKSDLWIVKEVLCVLDLYGDGDVDD